MSPDRAGQSPKGNSSNNPLTMRAARTAYFVGDNRVNAARLTLEEDLRKVAASIGLPGRAADQLDNATSHQSALHDDAIGAEAELPKSNVLRPDTFNRLPLQPGTPSGRMRPELAAALASVARATEAFRATEQQADRRAQRAIDIAFRSMAQVESFQAQLGASEARVEELTRQIEDDTVRHIAELELRENQALDLEERIAELNALITRQDDLMRDQAERLAFAEAQAAEAMQDLRYLSGQVSNALKLPAVSG